VHVPKALEVDDVFGEREASAYIPTTVEAGGGSDGFVGRDAVLGVELDDLNKVGSA